MAGRQPGWYDDPAVPGRMRWWDGQAWTQWLSDSREAPAPPPGGRRVIPVPTAADKVLRWGLVSAGVIMVVLAILAGIGMVQNRRTGPEVAPVELSPAPTVSPVPSRVRAEGQLLLIGNRARVPLPEHPDFGPPHAGPVNQALWTSQYISTAAGTEPGTGYPPIQAQGGLATRSLFAVGYGGTNAGVMARQTAEKAYEGAQATLGPVITREHSIGDAPGWLATVEISFTADGRQRTGTVTSVVAQIDAENWLVWNLITHDGRTSEQQAAADKALAGISISR